MWKEIKVKDLVFWSYIKALVRKVFLFLDTVMYQVNTWKTPTEIIQHIESFKCEMLDLLGITRNELYKK